MSDLDFFADLVATGTVLGLDHTSSPDEVEAVFGPVEEPWTSPGGMLHDFGLIEFGWHRDGRGSPWTVTYFGAQTHRLEWLVEDGGIEPRLVERYGPFRPRLDAGELLGVLRERGFPLEERPSLNDGCVEYWEPTSRMGLIAESSGEVVKVLGPQPPPAWLRSRNRRGTFESYADHLVSLSEPELSAWLDGREPAAGPGRADWWHLLRGAVGRRTGGDPAWWRLSKALDRQAAERGVDPPDEAAVTLVRTLVRDGADPGGAVERWLAAVPPLAEAARLAAARSLTPDEIRLSRRLRDQVHDLQAVLPSPDSPGLRAWFALRPALLGGG
ncbi:hypothetical protein ACSNOI_16640 [Actinomadura kijaniata]|uniref:hypothetical protein n=1 Tax=Actinomadura kijaniata TaxID=46161 RepID=UPI003F194489